jgi:hypothetical protein
MCDDIMSEEMDNVAMENTGIYISAVRTVLKYRGLRAVVVNPTIGHRSP